LGLGLIYLFQKKVIGECTTRGCRQLATWEIEVRGAGATFSLYYACDECCRVWAGILSPEDEIRAIGKNI